MNTQAHTPTPWKITSEVIDTTSIGIIRNDSEKKEIVNFAAYEFRGVSVEECNANARRIVECVNACSEMEDPKKDIFEMNLAIVKGLKTIEDRTKDINFLNTENLNQKKQIDQLKYSNKTLTTGLILLAMLAAASLIIKDLSFLGIL